MSTDLQRASIVIVPLGMAKGRHPERDRGVLDRERWIGGGEQGDTLSGSRRVGVASAHLEGARTEITSKIAERLGWLS